MDTTREDHDVECAKCGQVIGPCPDPDCVCRYNHAGGFCEPCREAMGLMEE